MADNELYHFGILGMHWGHRKAVDEGSSGGGTRRVGGSVKRSTSVRTSANTTAAKPKRKSIKDMSDAELIKKTQRMQLEQNYKNTKAAGRSPRQTSEQPKQTQSQPQQNQAKRKSLNEMSDAELSAVVNRLRLEQSYKQLNPQKVSAGKRFTKKVINDVLIPAATDASKQYAKDMFTEMYNQTKKTK